jgi:hypothetical protein
MSSISKGDYLGVGRGKGMTPPIQVLTYLKTETALYDGSRVIHDLKSNLVQCKVDVVVHHAPWQAGWTSSCSWYYAHKVYCRWGLERS